MKEIIKIIKEKEKEFNIMLMETDMKEIGKMVKKKEKEFITSRMVKNNNVFIKMVYKCKYQISDDIL